MKRFYKQAFLLAFGFLFSTNIFAQIETINLCASTTENGDDISVDVFVDNFTDIAAFQFGIAWTKADYEFVSLENFNENVPGYSESLFNTETENIPGPVSLLRTLWIDNTGVSSVTLEDDSRLFTLNLKKKFSDADGIIGIAPNDDFLIEFTVISPTVFDIAEVNVSGENCNVLAFSSIISSTEDLSDIKFSYSPNPVIDQLEISLSESVFGYVEIYTITGQRIITSPIVGMNKNLDLSNLKSGTYIIKLIDENEILSVRKLIKR